MKLRLFISLSMVVACIGQSVGQPTTTLYPVSDVSVYNSGANNTLDLRAIQTLNVGRTLTTPAVVSRTLFNFDLSLIPSNALIVSASLVLIPTGVESAAQNNLFKVERFTNMPTWTETSTPLINGAYVFSPSNAITSSDAVTTSTFTAGSSSLIPSTRTFNLTDHVQKMVSKQWSNKGWVLSANNEASNFTTGGSYYSGNCPIPAGQKACPNSPRLEVKYVLPFSVQAATIVHSSSSSTGNGSISATVIDGPTYLGTQTVYTWYNSAGAVLPPATSTITGLLPGWYGLRVMRNASVSPANSPINQPLYMAFLVGAQCASTTIAFNPGPNYIDDAPISTANVDAANGIALNTNASSARTVALSGAVTNTTAESGLRFRLWVDNQLSISKADLVLSGNAHVSSAAAPNKAQLIKLTGHWNENFASWNNLHSTTLSASPAPLALEATLTAGDIKTLDLIPFWSEWKQNNTTNYGLLLRPFPGIVMPATSFSTNMNFYSSDYTTDLTKRPKIDFIVTAAPSAGCLPTNIGEVPFSVLKTNFDGGYATTFQKQVKFTFQEEYDVAAGKYLSYEIFNDRNQLVASSTIDGSTTGFATPLPLKFDDNRYTLNIQNIAVSLNTYFTLVVTTPKGDKKKLKVFYKN